MTVSIDAFSITLSDIKDIVLSIAAITTATVAVYGLRKWKAELRGKAYFEASKELAKSVYKLRREIKYCRSPFIPASEFPKGYTPLGQTPKQKGDAYLHVYNNRWKSVGNALTELEIASLEAEALWGDRLKEAEKKLHSVASLLRGAIETIVGDAYSDGEKFGANEDLSERMNKYAHANWNPDEPDELETKLNEAVKEIEMQIKEYLRKP